MSQPQGKKNPGPSGRQSEPGARSAPGWIQDRFTTRQGMAVFYRFYSVPGARHTVIMLHGYGEHSGRYEKFPEKMGRLSAQFAVMDFRGMGRSENARGQDVSFHDYLQDVSDFVEHLRKKHAIPKKFILFGHSMGGLVAMLWAMKNPEPVKLLILSAPFLGFKFSKALRPLNRLMLLFAPRFIYRNPIRRNSLTHDPLEIENHKKDPLILRHISARLVEEIAAAMEFLQKLPILSAPFPVHMLVAGDERIVDPKATRRLFDRLVCPRKERTFLDGFFHEIFNEREQQKVFNVLKTIIEDCV